MHSLPRGQGPARRIARRASAPATRRPSMRTLSSPHRSRSWGRCHAESRIEIRTKTWASWRVVYRLSRTATREHRSTMKAFPCRCRGSTVWSRTLWSGRDFSSSSETFKPISPELGLHAFRSSSEKKEIEWALNPSTDPVPTQSTFPCTSKLAPRASLAWS